MEGMFGQDSIKLLQTSGIHFERFEENLSTFAEFLMTSGLVLLDYFNWLSFHKWLRFRKYSTYQYRATNGFGIFRVAANSFPRHLQRQVFDEIA